MPLLPARSALLLASGIGAILWLGTNAVTGRREAWDASLYWSVTCPLAIAVAGVLGYVAPDRSWRWGLAIMLAQAVTMVVISSSFGLLPLGLIMFAVLAVPPMLVARVAAGMRNRGGPPA